MVVTKEVWGHENPKTRLTLQPFYQITAATPSYKSPWLCVKPYSNLFHSIGITIWRTNSWGTQQQPQQSVYHRIPARRIHLTWNENDMLTKYFSLDAPWVVKNTTTCAATEEHFVNVTAYSFHCLSNTKGVPWGSSSSSSTAAATAAAAASSSPSKS